MRRKLATAGLAVVSLLTLGVFASPSHAAPTPVTAMTTVAAPAMPGPLLGPPPGSCQYRHLCIFKDALYSGTRLSFSYCENVNLFWSNFSMWLETSSLVNNQTIGTWSGFWETSNTQGPVLWQVAYGYRDNLVVDGWNDRIGYISVC